ncbi:hypothetical protein Ga0123462_0832 [Mariprofundus ferrinatatus]|uniref:Uncharacterized protein n=1 Tax=Mariprofundus ferrinatatus TaxID=1921087 RepID=A0A2K8L765_9PROT|nr:hypothetical protein Ga0123462_0832 [Mariprofundus ferrinatatus]
MVFLMVLFKTELDILLQPSLKMNYSTPVPTLDSYNKEVLAVAFPIS